ncbi:hypothetical protein GCM10022419_110850 [Nonomuraea rosea]|uniref:Core-binding (CB) domain-containing protein n=1 Tax=Nonomuraea rosea TaxID=638574 RepID=A0ABP6ZIZ0_9ACTN
MDLSHAAKAQPYRLMDRSGTGLEVANAYLLDLKARGHPNTTLYSYSMALMRWFRFLNAVEVPWDKAGREEARDFMLWLQTAAKPRRKRADAPAAGSVNAITGKRYPGAGYAASTAAHNETVARAFYDFEQEVGCGPLVNPFPTVRHRGGRANAHHNPLEPFPRQRAGLYRPQQPSRIPRSIPDGLFNDLFAAPPSHRDRARSLLCEHRGTRFGAARRPAAGRGHRAADHRGHPKGNSRAAMAARIDGCVRVAAALSGAGRADAVWRGSQRTAVRSIRWETPSCR